MPKEASAPHRNPEGTSQEKVLVNRIKDRKLFDGDREVAMNKTARIALFTQMEKTPEMRWIDFTNDNYSPKSELYATYTQDLITDPVEVGHKIIFSPSKLNLDPYNNKEFLAEKMEMQPEDVTVDMLATFDLMVAVKKYFDHKNDTYAQATLDWKQSLEFFEK
jgi:hypothetical protein